MKNYSYLKEKNQSSAAIEYNDRTNAGATLYGALFVYNYEYRLFGWHSVSECGEMVIQVQAYPLKNLRYRPDFVPEDNRGELREKTDESQSSDRTANIDARTELTGEIKINGVKYSLNGLFHLDAKAKMHIKLIATGQKKTDR